MESKAKDGVLKRKEIFLCTDNSTCESAFFKGNSESPLLFDLVLRLRVLCLEAGMKLHIVHVAGTHMISQGTNGISRGKILVR